MFLGASIQVHHAYSSSHPGTARNMMWAGPILFSPSGSAYCVMVSPSTLPPFVPHRLDTCVFEMLAAVEAVRMVEVQYVAVFFGWKHRLALFLKTPGFLEHPNSHVRVSSDRMRLHLHHPLVVRCAGQERMTDEIAWPHSPGMGGRMILRAPIYLQDTW